MRLEFITMRVIEEDYSLLGQCGARTIENRCCLAAALFVKRVIVRYPRAAGIFQPERFGFSGDTVNLIAKSFIRKMRADGFQPPAAEVFLELFRRQFVGPR